MAAAHIPRAFLSELVSKLGITKRQVYNLIEKIAVDSHVTSRTAAFLLAYQRGIRYQKYADAHDLAEMRSVRAGQIPQPSPPIPPAARPTAKVTARPKPLPPIKQSKNNSIFVVHGRDQRLRTDVFALLRAFDLNPIEWEEATAAATGANPNIGKIIDGAMKKAQGILVLFSPDERAMLIHSHCTQKERLTLGKLAPQSRPNVIFEAGLALGAHPSKTLLVQVGDMRDLSDIAGKHILRLSQSQASRNELANRLRKMGFKVNTKGSDWTTVGNFGR